MLDSLVVMVAKLAPVVFPLVMLSQLLLGALGSLVKLINPPKIKLYPAGLIEIGFSDWGPIVTLFGTMQAVRRNFFIAKINVEVRHEANNVAHTFEWRAFKPYIFGLHAEENVKYELVSAFSLKTVDPFKYNIVFVDDFFVEQVSTQARTISEAWKTFSIQATGNRAIGQDSELAAQREAFYQQAFVQAIAHEWQKNVYWAAGHYRLNVTIQGDGYKAQYPYYFDLSAEQAEILRSNVKQIVFRLCGGQVAYASAFVPYVK